MALAELNLFGNTRNNVDGIKLELLTKYINWKGKTNLRNQERTTRFSTHLGFHYELSS